MNTKTETKTAKRAVAKRKTARKKTTAAAAGEGEAKTTKSRRTAAKKTRKTKKTTKTTRKRKATKRSKATDESVAKPDAANESPSRAIRPLSTTATVAAESDAIVIRFPAAGAPPASKPVVAESQPAADAKPSKPAAPQPQSRPEPAPETDAGPLPDAPADRGDARELAGDAPPVSSRVATDERRVHDESGEHLSQSQKRRRRRKKRAAAAVEPAARPEPTPAAPDEDEPAEEMELDRHEPLEQREGPGPAEPDDERATAEPREESTAEHPAEPVKRRRRRGRRGRGSKEAAAAEPKRPAAPETREGPREGKPQPSRAARDEALPKPATKEMVINVAPREECRIAILESGKLEEIYLERSSSENHVGNIYKGVVTNVEPSIQAAFIDFGLGKNGFLHISDLHPQHFPNSKDRSETVGKKLPRRSRPPIQQCLRRGDKLLVQIIKEGIGTKGPTLTTYLSIPGRYMVMLPGMRRVGVSRKIEDDELRAKLRDMMSQLELPDDIGFIARTAASERTRRELQADLRYLTRLWQAVTKRIEKTRAPAELYRESDLVTRTIRDVYTTDIERIVVDDEEVAERAREFLAVFSPRSRDIVVSYTDPQPIFHRYGIETELERLHTRHVPLASGGSLVIDQTEALVAIDVNSGKFRTEGDAETTAYKINLEAANEIARQLRLRDLGGVVVCDFIDMRMEKHKREIERCLTKNLKAHKERAKILRMSQFGLIEITRQRQRASLMRSVYQDCQHCRGTGMLKTAESVTLDIMRAIQLAVTREHIKVIEVTTSPEVAHQLLNRKRALLHEFESRNNRTILVRPSATMALDQVTIQCYDQRGRLVPHLPGSQA